jgi:predicted O-methyltransferase YrrM
MGRATARDAAVSRLEVLADGTGWRVGDVTFVFAYGKGSTRERFLIRKPPGLMALYAGLGDRFRGATIVELGIAAGGSTALLALLLEPRHLVSCELAPEPVGALQELIDQRGLGSVIRPHYGVDQVDRVHLGAIVDAELGAESIDLVIDDASHLYGPTLSSFELLFPRLRPGGLFIVEDWAADYEYATRIASTLRDGGSAPSAALEAQLAALADGGERPVPLPRLAVELLHLAGGSREVVSELTINKHWLAVERGPADLDPASFRVRDHYVDHWGWLDR